MPYLTTYKAINSSLAISEMKLRRKQCISKPFIYKLDASSLCSMRCPTCEAHEVKTNKKRIMEFDDFKTIINRMSKYALRASLYDKGEPLNNKDIYKMIKYAGNNNISTIISTNLNLFHENDIDSLLDSGLTVLVPCLDGFTQETYERYRRGGDVEIVKKGIKLIMEQKRERGLKLPKVEVQVLFFDYLTEEISLIEEFLKECGVDRIIYREPFGNDSPKTNTNKNTCFWLYIGMKIEPDGSVFPCCHTSLKSTFSYGNVINQDISEIWNNKYYQFSRSLFSKGEDLDYNEEMLNVPCLKCKLFKRQRRMLELTPPTRA